jgi:prepilin-type N-terminal cleavage/methylation domain-containing protein
LYGKSVRSARGFTLLEILITTAVLVFGLAAVALMFSYTVRMNIDTRQRTTAVFLLNEKIEQLRFNPLQVGTYVDYPIVNNVTYIRQWQITEANPRSMTVSVLDARTRSELIRTSTLVNNPLQ